MSSHTTMAAMGTEIYLVTPKISSEAATPANSLTVFARLAMTMMPMMMAVRRTPRLSRIRSARPLPVTTPSRALISCTMIKASASSGMIHSRL